MTVRALRPAGFPLPFPGMLFGAPVAQLHSAQRHLVDPIDQLADVFLIRTETKFVLRIGFVAQPRHKYGRIIWKSRQSNIFALGAEPFLLAIAHVVEWSAAETLCLLIRTSAHAEEFMESSIAGVARPVLRFQNYTHPLVTIIHLNRTMGIFDVVGLTPLLKRTSGRPEITVGLIDGPVALDHPDLTGQRLREIRASARHDLFGDLGCDLENVSKPRALVDEDLQADFVWPENPARLR